MRGSELEAARMTSLKPLMAVHPLQSGGVVYMEP